jgi:hypothetical protein
MFVIFDIFFHDHRLAAALQLSADQAPLVARTMAIAREGLGLYGVGMTDRLQKLDGTLPGLLDSISDVISFCDNLTQLYPDVESEINKAATVLQDLQSEGRSFFADVRNIASSVTQSFPALTLGAYCSQANCRLRN